MRIAGLVAVAVVSGLVWSYIIDDDKAAPSNAGQESTTQDAGGRYTFTPHEEMPQPEKDDDCAKHAYRDIKAFLQETPCDHLTRQLFVTRLDDGRTVYTSVSLVVMRSEEDAEELRGETDKDGSGNINDVVREGMVKIPGLANLSGGNGYKAKQAGREVTIVESAFAPKDKGSDKKADEKELDAVCEDALRLVQKMDPEAGSG
jgi:hypothetical protein